MKNLAKILVLVLTVAALVGALVFAVSAETATTESGFTVKYTLDSGATFQTATVSSNDLLAIWSDTTQPFAGAFYSAGKIATSRNATGNNGSTAKASTKWISEITLLGNNETYKCPWLGIAYQTTLTLNLNGNKLVMLERFEVGSNASSGNCNQTALIINGADANGNKGKITNVGGKASVQLFQPRPNATIIVNDVDIEQTTGTSNFVYGGATAKVVFNNCVLNVGANNFQESGLSTDKFANEGTFIFNDTEIVSTRSTGFFYVAHGQTSGTRTYGFNVYFVGNSKISATKFADFNDNSSNGPLLGYFNFYFDEGVQVNQHPFTYTVEAIEGNDFKVALNYNHLTFADNAVTVGNAYTAIPVDNSSTVFPLKLIDEANKVEVTIDGTPAFYQIGDVISAAPSYGEELTVVNNEIYYVGTQYCDENGNALTADVTLAAGVYKFTTKTVTKPTGKAGYTIKYVKDGTTGEYIVLSDDIFAFLNDTEFMAIGVAALGKVGQYNVPVYTYNTTTVSNHITEIVYHNVNGEAATYTGYEQRHYEKDTTKTNPHYKLWPYQTHSLVLDLGGNKWNYDGGIVMGASAGSCSLTIKNGTINIDRLGETSSNSQFLQPRAGSTVLFDNLKLTMSYGSGQLISDSGASNITIRDSYISSNAATISLKDSTNDDVNVFVIDNSTVEFSGTPRINVDNATSAKNSWNFYILNGSKLSTGSSNFINVNEATGVQNIYIEEGTRFVAASLVKMAHAVNLVESIDFTADGVEIGNTFTDALYLANGEESYGYTLYNKANVATVILDGETTYVVPGYVIKAEGGESGFYADKTGVYTLGVQYKDIDTGEYITADVETEAGKTYNYILTENDIKSYKSGYAYAVIDANGVVTPYTAATITNAFATGLNGKYDFILYADVKLAEGDSGKKVGFHNNYNGTIDLNGHVLDYNGLSMMIGTSSNTWIEGTISFVNGTVTGTTFQVRPGRTFIFDGVLFNGSTWSINDGGAKAFTFNNCTFERGTSQSPIYSRQSNYSNDIPVSFNGCTFKGSALRVAQIVGLYQTPTTPSVAEDGTISHVVDWANPKGESYANVVISFDGKCDFTEAPITSNFITFNCRTNNDMYATTDKKQFKHVWWLAGNIVVNFDMNAKVSTITDLPTKNEDINVNPAVILNATNIADKNVDYTFAFNFVDGDKVVKYVYIEDGTLKPLALKSNLTLFTDFNLNFFLPAAVGEVVVTANGETVETVLVEVDGVNYIKFTIKNIAANAAAENVEFTITYYGNVTATGTYSIVNYATQLLASDKSTESKQLVKSAIEYINSAYAYAGAAASEALETLMNSTNYTTVNVATQVAQSDANTGNANVAISGATFALSTEIKLVLNLNSTYTGALKVNGKTYNVVDGTANGNTYIVIAMRAYDLYNQNVTIEGEGFSGSYDLAAYALQATGNVKTVVDALYTYCYYAAEYKTYSEANGLN